MVEPIVVGSLLVVFVGVSPAALRRCQIVCDVHCFDFAASFFQAGANLQEATWVRRHNDLGTGFDDILDFTILQAFGHFRLGQIVSSSAAATNVGFGEFDEIFSGDGFDEVARLFGDVLRMREVTSVVVSDPLTV